MPFYIVNKDNAVIAKCNYRPDENDLARRQQVVVESEQDLPIDESVYQEGRIKHRFKPVIPESDEVREERLVYRRMYNNVVKELRAEGKVKVLKEHTDG